MNYQKIYNQIINRAKNRKLTGYSERHHIIPRCMGGVDIKSNLVRLTAKEHFICHKLLTEIYPNESGLHYATFRMTHIINAIGEERDYRIGAREYQRLKENIGRPQSEETKQKIRESLTGITHSDEVNKKKGRSGELNVSKRKDIRKKISKALKGRVLSNEWKQKISESKRGVPVSEERKKKTSETMKKYWAERRLKKDGNGIGILL